MVRPAGGQASDLAAPSMRRTFLLLVLFSLALGQRAGTAAPSGHSSRSPGAQLLVLPEHLRPDPFGGIVAPDRLPSAAPAREIRLAGARNGYVSCHLVAYLPKPGPFRIEATAFRPAAGFEISAYREWFHFLPASNQYVPDALIPVQLPFRGESPDVDNRVANQTAVAFWLDLWIPLAASPGEYTAMFTLRAEGASSTISIGVEVLSARVPERDAVAMDHNAYGTSWFAQQYPSLVRQVGPGFFERPELYSLLHAYHRIFYEHRGMFHQLGYGHAGKVGPEFAPDLEGGGKSRHIVDWTRFDRHYGPLLDGSAFAGTHRGAKPIAYVYLPINPEWPASYGNWGEPGYEREFVNVVSEMERHFRDRHWTQTNFELFFNHKKRYFGFDWDGDEQRFPGDYAYLKEFGRLMKLAVPGDTPVHFVFRADVSWTMERQWRELAGVINFWVCGGGMFSWYPYAPELLHQRGDIVWTYGGTPAVTEPSSHIALDVMRPWVQHVDGFVRWLTTDAGADPWFHFEGGREAMVYPGDRFGIAGPVPSIRLKLERNAVQDVDLLETLATSGGVPDAELAARVRAGAVRSFNDTNPAEWWSARPALADTDPLDWSNATIDDATAANPKFDKSLDAAAWQRVREFLQSQLRTAARQRAGSGTRVSDKDDR